MDLHASARAWIERSEATAMDTARGAERAGIGKVAHGRSLECCSKVFYEISKKCQTRD